MSRMAAAPMDMDDLVEEILLRVPPDDPARLVLASLVCKRWRRIISDPGFHRRFREFHRTPPMLGFLCNHGDKSTFVPTSSFHPSHAACSNFSAIDARHGRVLLHSVPLGLGDNPLDNPFMVWDPISGEQRKLPLLPWSIKPCSWNAAVLCASIGACNHLNCYGRPFLVVLVGTDKEGMFAYVYSSEAAAWSERASAHLDDHITLAPSVLVGNALYFMLGCDPSIMKCDLGTREMTVIEMPLECDDRQNVLMTTEDGGLGFAYVEKYGLHLWSMMEAGPNRDVGWAKTRLVKLDTLLPAGALSDSLNVACVADGVAVIFLETKQGIFTIDLKSGRATRVFKCRNGWNDGIFPYMSFCTPALGAASTVGGPRAGTSSNA